MMETVLLLIGFSGDDPNFLNWSGWVRDNLGASAPKIYLAGYLELSQHRRRMLENRNIVPIDLARHPNANRWPENTRYEYATQWLLHTLENGEPYKITEWPSPSSPRIHPVPDYLQPVDEITATRPKEEPQPPNPRGSQNVDLAQAIKEVTAIWEHNRKMYPGWLALPGYNRPAVSLNTNEWTEATIKSLDCLAPTERLRAIREILWRKSILLEPNDENLANATETTLALFDCHNRTVDDEEAPDIDWKDIREAWRNSAAELATNARLSFEREPFRRHIEDLRRFADEDPDIQQRICHEQCLWALYDLDFAELDRLLSEWQTENCDPVWLMRKSAVLSEAGRDDESEQLRQQAVNTIRAMPPDDRSVASPSREGWAILPAADWQNQRTIANRLNELAALKCDAVQERDTIANRIVRNGQGEAPPAFDLGMRTVSSRFSSNYPQMVAAYQAIRLAEVAGLPAYVSISHELPGGATIPTKRTVSAEFLRQAANELTDWNYELAIRLALRASSSGSDTTFASIFTRTRVATLTPEQAETLAKSCWNAIANAMHDLKNQVHQPQKSIAIEALSRLVIRLPYDQAETVFEQALELSQNQQIARGNWIRPIRHLLYRSWEALPAENRNRRAIALLNTPIAGLDSHLPSDEYGWTDPAGVLEPASDVLQRTPDNEQQWQTAVDLVTRGLVSNAAVRHRASIRMASLVQSGHLTDAETLKIARALWNEQYIAPDELPRDTVVLDWEFLTYLEPTSGTAEERFRNKWLSGNVELSNANTFAFAAWGDSSHGLNHNPKDVRSRLWQVGQAIRSLREQGRQLSLSEAEKQHLTELLETWANDPVPERRLLEA